LRVRWIQPVSAASLPIGAAMPHHGRMPTPTTFYDAVGG
jgi:hypothetical protein